MSSANKMPRNQLLSGMAGILVVAVRLFYPEGLAAVARHDYYAIFELRGLVDGLWGGANRLALEPAREPRVANMMETEPFTIANQLSYYWSLRDLKLGGPTCAVTLDRVPRAGSNLRIALSSLYYRLIAPLARAEWLDEVVAVRVTCGY